jgi:hypothetical protein
MGFAAAVNRVAQGGPPPGIAPGQPGAPPVAPPRGVAAGMPPQVPMPMPMRPAPMGGGGGGFGKLEKRVAEDQRAVMGSYTREEEDTQKLADAQIAKADEHAEMQRQVAAQQQAMILAQQERDQDASMRLQTWRDQSMKYADDLRSQKLDPNRYMANQSTGAKMGMIAGGILGGILSAWQGGENQFIKTINGEIDKDIRAQQESYERGKDFLKQRDTVYGQMVQSTGDQRLAAMQVRQSLLESAKMDLEAQAQKLGIPEIHARAKIAIGAIDREQKNLGMQWDQYALQAAQRQAAAAQAARVAQEKLMHDRAIELTKLGQEQQKIDIERDKAGAAAAGKETKGVVNVKDTGGNLVQMKAVSEDAAKNYQEYSKIAPEARRLIGVMKQTYDHPTSKAEYEAARHKLIEIMPAVFGFGRGPSVAQVEHTFGPEAIPEHRDYLRDWSWNRRNGQKALDDLDAGLSNIDRSTKEATFSPKDLGNVENGTEKKMPDTVQMKE